MTDHESEVPIDLRRELDDAEDGTAITGALAVFPPDEWPPCPECNARLDAVSVAVGDQGGLVGARMVCTGHAPAHRYVYEANTGTVYFDGVVEPVAFGEFDPEE